MRALVGVLFPVLAGRVNAALRIRGLEAANGRLVRENARLRSTVDRYEAHRQAAHARLSAAARGGAR